MKIIGYTSQKKMKYIKVSKEVNAELMAYKIASTQESW